MACQLDIGWETTRYWKIDRQETGTIILAKSQEELSEFVDAGNFDYLVVFTQPVVGERWKRPYFEQYVDEGALFSIYEPANASLVITGCESTEGWYATRGHVTFSLASGYGKDGHCIGINGKTDETGATRIYYDAPGTWDLGGLDTLGFCFRLENATHPRYFSVILSDGAGNYRYWINGTKIFYNWDSGDWQDFGISLKSYKGQQGEFDLERVDLIQVFVYADSNTSITYQLDCMRAHSTIRKAHASISTQDVPDS